MSEQQQKTSLQPVHTWHHCRGVTPGMTPRAGSVHSDYRSSEKFQSKVTLPARVILALGCGSVSIGASLNSCIFLPEYVESFATEKTPLATGAMVAAVRLIALDKCTIQMAAQ